MRNLYIFPVLLTLFITAAFAEKKAADKPQYTPLIGEQTGTLSLNKSPYLVTGDVTVPDSGRLTIQPGVTVVFDVYARIEVRGHLRCIGTVQKAVTFTVDRETPGQGMWDGIYFMDSSSGDISHSIVEYGTFGIYCQSQKEVDIRKNIIRHNKMYGIYTVDGSAPRITDNLISFGNYGIVCYNGAAPHIIGNLIRQPVLSGIYCFIGASPRIDNNVITGSEGNAIFCVDKSNPLIEYNLLNRNLSGITCTDSDPLIVNNSINTNHLSGIICSNSSPQVRFNNIFGNNLYNLNILGEGTVKTSRNWWGEESYVVSLNENGEVSRHLGRSKINGNAVIFDYSVSPYDFPFEQPKSLADMTMVPEGGETTSDEFHIGDMVTVTFTGVDRSSTTRDHLSFVIRHADTRQSVQKMLAEETEPASGSYTRTFRLDEKSLLYIDGKIKKYNVEYEVFSPVNPGLSHTFRIVNRKPEVSGLVTWYNGWRNRVSSLTPFRVEWNYSDPDSVVKSQTQARLQIATTTSFDEFTKVYDKTFATDTNTVICAGAPLKAGLTYYARVQARDQFEWSQWHVSTFVTNTPPPPPEPFFPENGMVLKSGLWASPVARRVPEPEVDKLVYLYEFYISPTAEKPFAQGAGQHRYIYNAWTPDSRLEENGRYWWRVGISDGLDTTWATVRSFSINMVDEPIQPFLLYSPGDDTVISGSRVTFRWQHTQDPDPGQDVRYTLWLTKDRDFTDRMVVNGLTDSTFTLDIPLEEGVTYQWKVKAVTDDDNFHWSNTTSRPFNTFRVKRQKHGVVPVPEDERRTGLVN